MAVTAVQREWVSRVLGFDAAEDGVPAAPLAPEVGPGVELAAKEKVQDFSARLKIVDKDMRAYGLLETLGGTLRRAAEATKARSPEADGLLDELEREIAAAAGRKRMEGVRETVQKASVSARSGVVALGKARVQLAMARSTYATVRQTLVDACEQTRLGMVGDGVADDPMVIAAVAKVGEKVPDIDAMSGEVEDALDAMIGTADVGERDLARQKAITAIGTYRARVDGEPILVRMQSGPAGNFAIRDALVGALDTLERVLAA